MDIAIGLHFLLIYYVRIESTQSALSVQVVSVITAVCITKDILLYLYSYPKIFKNSFIVVLSSQTCIAKILMNMWPLL